MIATYNQFMNGVNRADQFPLLFEQEEPQVVEKSTLEAT
jgi:hypothetical protein